MSLQDHDDLLRRATEAARAGRKTEAYNYLQEILDEDDKNVRAWMLFYRVTDDIEEKKIALTEVVRLDPTNSKAQEALQKLEAKLKQRKEEIAPGLSRRQITLMAGGFIGALLVIVLLFVLISSGREGERQQMVAQQTAFVIQQTAVIETQTQAVIDATETQLAIATPTPTPTNTRVGPPTLPPPFTPTFTPTPPISPTPLPPPSALQGMIIGWGGPDLSNDGYFPIIAMPLSGGGQYQVISRGERGYHAGASSLSNVVYSRYFPSVYTTELLTLDVTQSTSSRTTELWRGRTQLIFERPDYPNFSVDGSRMVFVGTDFNTGTRSVYLYDANATGDPIKQLTSDGRTYEFPSLSPDGRMVIAVRVETNQSPPGRDLMYINTETLAMQPLTSDGSNTLETMPRWSPDGQIIAYAVTSNDGRYDLFIRTADGAGGALNITNHPADDIYPVFSPDSRHLAFSSNRQGNYNLYIYDLLDSRMYQLTTTTDNFFAGAWLP